MNVFWGIKYIDSHAHAYEYEEEYLRKLERDFIILGVSDDLESSKKTLMLTEEFSFIKPCIGIHPWRIDVASRDALKQIEELVELMDKPCIGEVGLDKKFTPNTYEAQMRTLQKFLSLAKETGAILNLHAAGAWEEVADLVMKFDISHAVFHWYTGPKDLMERLQEAGFYISFNVAALFQKKHSSLLPNVDLRRVLTESDGPYEYRGQKLLTENIPPLLKFMARELKIDEGELKRILFENASRLFL
jgi:TatD DNase family protein